MRFTLDDLYRGHVSEDRIREVVHQSSLADVESKLRSNQQLLKQLKRDLKFNPVKLISNPNVKQGGTLNKYFNNIVFFAKLQDANLKLIQNEFKVLIEKQEKMLRAYVQQQARLEKLKEEAKRSEMAYVTRMEAKHKEQLAALMAEHQRMDTLLLELNNQRTACDRALQAINRSIAISRELHVREALECADKVVINGKKLFENNSPEEIEGFTRDLFKAQEKHARAVAHFDHLIKRELEESQVQMNGLSSFDMHKVKSNPKIREYEKQKELANETMHQEIREAADHYKVKPLDSSVSTQELENALEAIGQTEYGAHLNEHAAGTYKAQGQIEKVKDFRHSIDQQINLVQSGISQILTSNTGVESPRATAGIKTSKEHGTGVIRVKDQEEMRELYLSSSQPGEAIGEFSNVNNENRFGVGDSLDDFLFNEGAEEFGFGESAEEFGFDFDEAENKPRNSYKT